MDINFACAMGPPGGGRNPITQRLTRHFNFLSFTELDDASKKNIFSTILGSWMGKQNYRVLPLGLNLRPHVNVMLVNAG